LKLPTTAEQNAKEILGGYLYRTCTHKRTNSSVVLGSALSLMKATARGGWSHPAYNKNKSSFTPFREG